VTNARREVRRGGAGVAGGEARDFAQADCAETMAEFQGLLLALEQGWEVLESESRELDRVGTSH
jgi:hypothetical protein